MAFDIDVESGKRGRDADIEGLLRATQRCCDGMGRGERTAHLRRKNGTDIKIDHVMRACPHEADPRLALRIETRMKCGAPAPFAMRVDVAGNLRLQSGMAQRLNEKSALPIDIGPKRKRLHRATPAGSVMRTKGRDPVGTWLRDFDQPAARALDIGEDPVAGQGVGHIDRAICVMGDAFTALAEARDFKVHAHQREAFVAPTRYSRLPSEPWIGDPIRPAICQPAVLRSAAIRAQALSRAAAFLTIPLTT